jgi:hypothetical protein
LNEVTRMTDPLPLPLSIVPVVNAIVHVASKPYIDFIELLRASGRITELEVESLNREVQNQRLILVDLTQEELAKARGQS